MPPRLARLVALLAAIALVAGAFVLRATLAGDDGETTTAGGDPADGEDGAGESHRVACDADLGEDACAAIGDLDGVASVETLTASEAVAAMSEEEIPAFHAWVTLDPWPAILDVARDVETLTRAVTGDPIRIASSPLSVLTFTDRGLECPSPVEWPCLVGAAPTEPIGLPRTDTAVGLVAFGHAAVGLVGETDFGTDAIFGTEVADQMGALLDSGAAGSTAQQARLSLQPGNYRAVVTSTGLAERQAATEQGRDGGAVVHDLAPPATIGVVLAPIGADGPAAVEALTAGVTSQTVVAALGAAGWTGDPAPTTGLPDPDVLYALQKELGS